MANLHYLTEDIPGIGGRLYAEPEDFFVEEIPLYRPAGAGEHVYCEIEKRDLTTREAISRISRALSVKEREIGAAGNKDKHTVSRQMLSIRGVSERDVEKLEIPGIKILWVRRHNNKLRIGHLEGNRFRIRVRDLESVDESNLTKTLDILTKRGVPNYFGYQRFGRAGDSHLIGRALLVGNDKEVIDRLGGDSGTYFMGPRRDIRSIKRDFRYFFVHAYQSHLFNKCLEKRLSDFDALWKGDLAYKHDNGAVFRVEDAEKEADRLGRFEISPSGPLFGHKMIEPEGREKAIEDEVLSAEGVAPDILSMRFKEADIKGVRRSYRFPVKELKWEHSDKSVIFSFVLPKGCYATSFLREIMKTQ
ncbi:MAG: tRNA pseudouridine(13) synthase TruD [Candidatus Omnitrophica bacterium]|nr:tRNA pseudouridine(13) synthase TruD [Candidatus Omnitrophota bacterium]